MRSLLALLLLLPLFCTAQPATYFSAEASVGLGKGLDNTVYGVGVSGNLSASEKLFFGGSVSALRIAPFLQNVALPVLLRATFFPVQDEERANGFFFVEGGKIFHHEKGTTEGQAVETKGKYAFFGGVGLQMPSQTSGKVCFGAGLALMGFEKNVYNPENHLLSRQSFLLKRLVLKAAVLLRRAE